MNEWIEELLKVGLFMLGNPESVVERVIVGLLAAGAFLLVMTKAGDALRLPASETTRSFAILAITLVAGLALIAAVNTFVAPQVGNEATRKVLPIVAAIVVLLGLSAPATCLIQKGSYGHGLAAVAFSVLAAILIVVLVNAGIGAVHHGGAGFDKTRERRDAVDNVISP